MAINPEAGTEEAFEGAVYTLGEKSRFDLTDEDIKLLEDVDGEGLSLVVTRASEQRPPNEILLGVIGGLAAARLLENDFDSPADRNFLTSIIPKVFPRVSTVGKYKI